MTSISKSIPKLVWFFGAAVAATGVLGVVFYSDHRAAPIWGRGPDLHRIEIKFPEARDVLNAASAYVQKTRSWSPDEFRLEFLVRDEDLWTIHVLGKEDAKELGRMIGCGDSFNLDYDRAARTFSESFCE